MSEAHVPQLKGRDSVRITIAVIGTLLGLASMLTVLGIMAYSNRPFAPLKNTVATVPAKIEVLKELQAQDRLTLESYGKDPITGDQRIPIGLGMEKVVAEYQKK